MVTTLQTTDSIAAGSQFIFGAAGDSYHILAGVTVASVDADAVGGNLGDNNLRVDGTVVAEGTGVFMGGGGNQVTVGPTGSVVSNLDGTTGSAVGLGTDSNDGGSTLTNFGSISAPGRIGVLVPRGDVVNHGSIDGVTPVYLGVFGRAGATLTNSGTISAVGEGEDQGTRYRNGVFVEGDNGLITNSANGVIMSSYAGAAAVRLGSTDGAGGGGSRIVNAGEILSVAGVGIDASEVPSGSGVTVLNAGVVSGAGSAIRGSLFSDQVTNSGDILGNIRLAAGNDVFQAFGDGAISGTVRGGGGSDTLLGNAGDELFFGDNGFDSVHGGQGNDFIEGNIGIDTLRGGAGVDTISGGDDADVIFGGQGEDLLLGGTGADMLRGGLDDDNIAGGRGFDTLRGGRGDDTLLGGDGDDRLVGGQGLDTMTGGNGADVFVFFEGADRDLVTDFTDGTDLVDLSSFGLANFADMEDRFSLVETTDGVRIEAGDDVLILQGATSASLNGADFIF